MEYYAYLIYSPLLSATYIGITNDIYKRILQHNNILSGGAKSTKKTNDWMYYCFVGCFNNKSEAMRFEWLWKHYKPVNKWISTKGLKNRLDRLYELLDDIEWQDIDIIYLSKQ